MAHQIAYINGKASIAYAGEKPWHGLGQKLTDDATLDQWRVEAGLDWEAKESQVKYETDFGLGSIVDRKVIYRSDNHYPLGIVSNDYKVVQPAQVIEFFRDLVEGNSGFKMESAGVLFHGKKIWASVRTGSPIIIMGQDAIKPYLLLATAMDGTMATCGHFTSTRVVCNNTLSQAIGGNGRKANVRFTHQSIFNPDKMKLELGLVQETWETFVENIGKLAATKISMLDAIDFVAQQLKDEWLTKEGNQMDQYEMLESSKALSSIIELYQGKGLGSDFRSSKGTAWGLVNAVTQYMDHEVGSKADPSWNFEKSQFGERAKFKVELTDKLLKLAA